MNKQTSHLKIVFEAHQCQPFTLSFRLSQDLFDSHVQDTKTMFMLHKSRHIFITLYIHTSTHNPHIAHKQMQAPPNRIIVAC